MKPISNETNSSSPSTDNSISIKTATACASPAVVSLNFLLLNITEEKILIFWKG